MAQHTVHEIIMFSSTSTITYTGLFFLTGNTTEQEGLIPIKPIILWSLLGFTTLLLLITLILLVCFIAANIKLKQKVKQYAKSHKR